MRVAIVAEYYPRAADPVLGVWTHRQALAVRDAGVDVRVLVLHRPVPPLASLRAGDVRAARAALRQPRRAVLDGIEVAYVPSLAPPRPWSYGAWGAWAAPTLGRALRRLRATFPFDLVHAHYAVPAGDAVRRALPGVPLVVSVHGGDVLAIPQRSHYARRTVARTLAHARLVLANSAGTERRARALGAHETTVVHLGTDLPQLPVPRPDPSPTLVTVGHLVARKRHADVIRALARLAPAHPGVRYVVVGDGPEREPLRALAAQLGVADRVELTGQLPPAAARERAWQADVLVLPSVDEAFGVAYVEAMAGGVPAIGCAGEDGPEEIAAAGEGLLRVPGGDVAALAAQLDRVLGDEALRKRLGAAARATVERSFTWEACGAATVAGYARVHR
jgi:glycosyltransferase involved in cell wall biosynthesis